MPTSSLTATITSFGLLLVTGPAFARAVTPGAPVATVEAPAARVDAAGDYVEVTALPLTFQSIGLTDKPLAAPVKKFNSSGSEFSAVDPTLKFRAAVASFVFRAAASQETLAFGLGYQVHELFELGFGIDGSRSHGAEGALEETVSQLYIGPYAFFRTAFSDTVAVEAHGQIELSTGQHERGTRNETTGATDLNVSIKASGFRLGVGADLVVRLTDRLDYAPGFSVAYLAATHEHQPVMNAAFIGDKEYAVTQLRIVPVALRLRF